MKNTLFIMMIVSGLTTALAVANDCTKNELPAWLEDRIPFDIRISMLPREACDPIELNVVTTIQSGTSATTRWQVMEGDRIQMEFFTFDDLYYQCDGPGCFNIRSTEIDNRTGITRHHTRVHVCLK